MRKANPAGRLGPSDRLTRLSKALLDGARGTPPADREAIIDAVVSLSDTAWALREENLVTVEVNPLVVRGSSVQGLDALFEFSEQSA